MDILNQNSPLETNNQTAIDLLNLGQNGLDLSPLKSSTTTAITPVEQLLTPISTPATTIPSTYAAPLSTTALQQSISNLAANVKSDPLFVSPTNNSIAAGSSPQPLNITLRSSVASAPNYALKSGGVVNFNGKSNLEGNPNTTSDDAFIYAEKGFVFSGNATLPVQRDANNNPVITNGKETLLTNAVSVATGYLVASAGANGKTYSNLTPPQIVGKQPLNIPSFSDLKQQVLNRIPTGVNAIDLAGNTTTRTYGVTIARGDLLTLALLNDTGASNTDGITSDINVRGQVADRHQISRLELALDNSTNFADLTVALQLDGSFRLLPAQLDGLAGGKLSLGAHKLTARGVLADGSIVSSVSLDFTYQAANSNIPTLSLATASDTNTIGDLVTSLGTVDLIAQTQAGLTVKLGDKSAIADANGQVTFSGVTLALGANSLVTTTVDTNGETASSSTTITRTNPDDVILTWNRIALNAIRRDNLTTPSVAAKVLAMVQTAIYDAANAIEQKYGTYRVDATPIAGADEIAAAAEAAYRVLSKIYTRPTGVF